MSFEQFYQWGTKENIVSTHLKLKSFAWEWGKIRKGSIGSCILIDKIVTVLSRAVGSPRDGTIHQKPGHKAFLEKIRDNFKSQRRFVLFLVLYSENLL